MTLILTAPGIITAPTYQVPDFVSGRYLAWDARDIAAANGATVSSWPAAFATADTLPARRAMEAVVGGSFTLPTYVTNARGGVPGVRFGDMAALAAGYRAAGTPADASLIKLAGQPISLTAVARLRETAPSSVPQALFSGSGGSDHRVRQGSSNTNRLVVQDSATALTPFIELPGAVGNWFAVTVAWDKPAGRIHACLNGGALLSWTSGNQPANWTQIVLGRIIGVTTAGAAGIDYARVEMHSRALRHRDMQSFHGVLRQDYGITDWV